MEFTDKQFDRMMDALRSNAEAIVSATNQNLLSEIRQANASIADLRTEVRLLRQNNEQHAREQTALTTRLVGEKDDGIIYQLTNAIKTRVDKLESDHSEHVSQAKKNDAATGIIAGIFSVVTNYAMQHFGVNGTTKVVAYMRAFLP